MERKIIQISTDSQPESQDTGRAWWTITALCDDGTVWESLHSMNLHGKWQRIPQIPQDTPNRIEELEDALKKIEAIKWGNDGDCGAQRIIDNVLGT